MNIQMKQNFHPADSENPLNYAVFTPENYDDLPLLVYLHGAGERGGDYSHVFRHGIPEHIAAGEIYPAIVLVPQCPCEFVWDNVAAQVKAIIDRTAAEFAVSPDRICITGSSMGGYGTWMMGLTYPNYFSAIAPIAGGGMAWRASNLRTTPVFAIHGGADDCVLPDCSRMMCDALRRAGGNVRLEILPGKGHNDGIDAAYDHPELIPWLFSSRRTDFTPVPEFCSEWF